LCHGKWDGFLINTMAERTSISDPKGIHSTDEIYGNLAREGGGGGRGVEGGGGVGLRMRKRRHMRRGKESLDSGSGLIEYYHLRRRDVLVTEVQGRFARISWSDGGRIAK